MILRCPSCSAQYLVANTSIGPTGRKVRCSSCGNVWFQDPPTQRSAPQVMAPEPPADRPPRASRTDGPDGHGGEARRPPNINLPAMRQTRRSGKALVAGWLGLLLLVGGIAAGGYFAREDIVRFWPPAVQLYEKLGIDLAEAAVDAFPPGLNLSIVHSEFAEQDGEIVLLLRGEISNEGTEPIDAPPLEISLTDENGEPVESWVIAVADTAIEPGASIGFETRRVDPSAAATSLELRPTARRPDGSGAAPDDHAPPGEAPHDPPAHDTPEHSGEDGHGAEAPGLEFPAGGHVPAHEPAHGPSEAPQ